jgi:hypothetical protein
MNDVIFSLYNNIHRPSKLVVGADFHCFKEKIEPKWEDPICANGGKWTISCVRGKSDTLWLHTVSVYRLSIDNSCCKFSYFCPSVIWLAFGDDW